MLKLQDQCEMAPRAQRGFSAVPAICCSQVGVRSFGGLTLKPRQAYFGKTQKLLEACDRVRRVLGLM